jgi:hypothetical protein
MPHNVSFNYFYKTRCFLVACSVVSIASPSMMLLAKPTKIMCEKLKTKFVIRSFEDSTMQTKKLGR